MSKHFTELDAPAARTHSPVNPGDHPTGFIALTPGAYAALINMKLAKFVGSTMGDQVDIDIIDLNELDLPMFSEDTEAQGVPASVFELKDRMIACDGFLVASPEYNGSISGALKNAIDWASRPREGEAVLACTKGKVVGLLAASPGGLGGIRGLRHVRQILTQLQAFVVPSEYALGGSFEAFNDDGTLKDERAASMATGVGQEVIRVINAFNK